MATPVIPTTGEERAKLLLEKAMKKGGSEQMQATRAKTLTSLGGTPPETPSETSTPTTGPERDLEAEAETASAAGFVPTTDQEKLDAAIATYGTNLPAEFQAIKDKLDALKGTTDTANLAALQGVGSEVSQYGQTAADYAADVATQKGQIPMQLNVLQDALKMTSGVGNQPLGTSDIFQQAGVGGYGALTASLNARKAEMDYTYDSFANVVNKIAGSQYAANTALANKAQLALDQYGMLRDEYRYEMDRLDSIASATTDYERQLKLMEKEAELNAEKEASGDGGIFTETIPTDIDVDNWDWTASGSNTILTYTRMYPGSSANAEGPDFAAPVGTQVNSNVSGQVISVSNACAPGQTSCNSGWGNQIKIKDVNGNVHTFNHLSSAGVKVGDTVSYGQSIGASGNTGYVLGGNGETLSQAQIDSGRGAHLDYTVFKPDGTKYTLAEAMGFAFGNEQLTAGTSQGTLEAQATALLQGYGGTESERQGLIKQMIKMVQSGEAETLADAKKEIGFKTTTDEDFIAAVKEDLKAPKATFTEISTKLDSLPALLESETGIGDVAAIVNFLKTIDPNSVARESEVASVQNAVSLGGQIEQVGNRLANGKKLTDAQRVQLMDAVKIIKAATAAKLYEDALSYQKDFNDRGLEFVLISNTYLNNVKSQLTDDQIAEIEASLVGTEEPEADPDEAEYDSYSIYNDPDYQEGKTFLMGDLKSGIGSINPLK